jgi:hypothetical protein
MTLFSQITLQNKDGFIFSRQIIRNFYHAVLVIQLDISILQIEKIGKAAHTSGFFLLHKR